MQKCIFLSGCPVTGKNNDVQSLKLLAIQSKTVADKPFQTVSLNCKPGIFLGNSQTKASIVFSAFTVEYREI